MASKLLWAGMDFFGILSAEHADQLCVTAMT